MLQLTYDRAFSKALTKMDELCSLHHYDSSYIRNQLSNDYSKHYLDPDGKAVRYYDTVKCTADALLSIRRICSLEGDTDKVLKTYEQYRKIPIFYFPCEIGGINTSRASILGDKIDWTLLDLKQFYTCDSDKCRLSSAYKRLETSKWLESLGSYENLVDWLNIKGIFTDKDYNVYNIENGRIFEEVSNDSFPDKVWSVNYYENLKQYIQLMQ